MITAEVYLWGTRIGVAAQESPDAVPMFNYDEKFLKSGIEVSPIVMPLSERVYSFPALPENTFHGLPGLLADSLPDKFGTKLIERYLSEQGRDIRSFSAVERLLYTGKRGMGALEYVPARDYGEGKDCSVDINALVELASDILTERENLHVGKGEHAMEQIINVGTSAGGARAKAVIAWNPSTGDFRSGQIDAGEGYEYWLIKFDGVRNNKDKGDKEDGTAYTRIEYAYYLLAQKAGIVMNDCRLYQESGRYHFMTKRFDRGINGAKLHMQSLGAIAHYDYNMPGAYSYEQAVSVINSLELGQAAVEQMFRRMVFNILYRNQDDHVKNISFLMDRRGNWSLAPAYDITYANDADNKWLARHQMSLNGKTEGFETDDFYAGGRHMNLTKRKVDKIVEQVRSVIQEWEDCAGLAYLDEESMETVRQQFIRL
ncbi:MAG: type II toxin-antitoxin system HipA family toxin [Lachnospiraceae bacterium]|nr:type II toxin-antitoxin system HipA family toxin [Lachnospiraceae bacterium]